jgi:hypothetical protein
MGPALHQGKPLHLGQQCDSEPLLARQVRTTTGAVGKSQGMGLGYLGLGYLSP